MPDAPVLFISLGTSPAIVPEAYLLAGVPFCAVHVLTTERPDVALVREFFASHAAGAALTLSRVAGFEDFTSGEDHFRFEEVLYRWILAAQTRPEDRYLCLSGGFKTMSAAMQKAAAVLGAHEVFHVLADPCCPDAHGKPGLPVTIDQVLQAHAQGHLHLIPLGPQSGWPQLRSAHPADYPLEIVRETDGVRWVRAPNAAFSERLRQVVERSHRIAGAWDQLHDLPFAELATCSESGLRWLHEPLDPAAAEDQAWVADLPKIDLHCHLGGFATHGELLAQVRAAAQFPEQLPALRQMALPPRWPLPEEPIGLEAYRRLGDNNGSTLLRDPGCLVRQCELLYQHLLQQRVLYAEIRCSPANYADPERSRSPWDVLVDIRETFNRCMIDARQAALANPAAPACAVNLIIIGTRRDRGDFRAGIARHLALAATAAEHWRDAASCRVVGVDLAGFEDRTTRAQYFREEFVGIHRCGVALTVHAGENDDAEGIWSAVFDLNARRLGHALSLGQSPKLLRSVADRGIGVEMCPYANFQIRGFPLDTAGAPGAYPLRDYLREGVRVSVNTDNIGISAATLTDNLLLAARLCPGLTRLELLWLLRHALDTAFVSQRRRTQLLGDLATALRLP